MTPADGGGTARPEAHGPDPSAPSTTGQPGPAGPTRRPLYPRLLRLRHIHPNGWQRALLGEGVLALAAVLVLADLASAWTLLVLPLAVAAVVKAHDLLAGVLQPAVETRGASPSGGNNDDGAGPESGTGAVEDA